MKLTSEDLDDMEDIHIASFFVGACLGASAGTLLALKKWDDSTATCTNRAITAALAGVAKAQIAPVMAESLLDQCCQLYNLIRQTSPEEMEQIVAEVQLYAGEMIVGTIH